MGREPLAVVGVVRDDDVARLEVVNPRERGADVAVEESGDAEIGGIGEEPSGRRRDGRPEVARLLDVGGAGGALQGDRHLLGDGGELVEEDLHLDGIELHAASASVSFRVPSRSVRACQPGRRERRSIRLLDDGGAAHDRPGPDPGPSVDVDRNASPFVPDLAAAGRLGRARLGRGQVHRRHPADHPEPDRGRLDRGRRIAEAVAPVVLLVEEPGHRLAVQYVSEIRRNDDRQFISLRWISQVERNDEVVHPDERSLA